MAAHVAAGGAAPSLGVVALCLLVVTTVCMPLTGRRIGRRLTLGLLAGTQLALHTTFTALGQAAPNDHYALSWCGHAQLLSHGAAPGDLPMHMGPVMLLAHALATIALALVLAHGESLLWSLASFLGRRLPTSRAGSTPHGPVLILWPHTLVRPRVRFDPVPSRRGPPSAVVA